MKHLNVRLEIVLKCRRCGQPLDVEGEYIGTVFGDQDEIYVVPCRNCMRRIRKVIDFHEESKP